MVTQCLCSKSRSRPALGERASSGRTVPYTVVGGRKIITLGNLSFIAYFECSFWNCVCPRLCWHSGTVGLSAAQSPFGSVPVGEVAVAQSSAAGGAPWAGVALLAGLLPGPSPLPTHSQRHPGLRGPWPWSPLRVQHRSCPPPERSSKHAGRLPFPAASMCATKLFCFGKCQTAWKFGGRRRAPAPRTWLRQLPALRLPSRPLPSGSFRSTFLKRDSSKQPSQIPASNRKPLAI